MLIDITPILKGICINVNFEGNPVFDMDDLKKTDIKELKDVHVKGTLTKIEDELYTVSFSMSGTMMLEDALTLELLPYKFNIEDENDYEVGSYLKINENLLDIYAVLWENVVLEVPLRIVKEEKDVTMEGNGWSLNKKSDNNSGLSELSKLLDLEEEK